MTTKTSDKLPKKNNASDGKKAHRDSVTYKVGRIKFNSWAAKVISAGNIIIDETELVHIAKRHKKELEQIGLTAFDFVKFIADNFNRIYKGSGDSVLLVVKRENVSNTAAIEVTAGRPIQHKIKTAMPIKNAVLLKKELLCANDR